MVSLGTSGVAAWACVAVGGIVGLNNFSWGAQLIFIRVGADPTRCLRPRNGDPSDGNSVELWDCLDSGFKFIVPRSGAGCIRLARTNMCLMPGDGGTSNGNDVQIRNCKHCSDFAFQLPASGYGPIRMDLIPTKCLKARAGRAHNGNVVQMWDCGTGGAFDFDIIPGSRPYEIQDVMAGSCYGGSCYWRQLLRSSSMAGAVIEDIQSMAGNVIGIVVAVAIVAALGTTGYAGGWYHRYPKDTQGTLDVHILRSRNLSPGLCVGDDECQMYLRAKLGERELKTPAVTSSQNHEWKDELEHVGDYDWRFEDVDVKDPALKQLHVEVFNHSLRVVYDASAACSHVWYVESLGQAAVDVAEFARRPCHWWGQELPLLTRGHHTGGFVHFQCCFTPSDSDEDDSLVQLLANGFSSTFSGIQGLIWRVGEEIAWHWNTISGFVSGLWGGMFTVFGHACHMGKHRKH